MRLRVPQDAQLDRDHLRPPDGRPHGVRQREVRADHGDEEQHTLRDQENQEERPVVAADAGPQPVAVVVEGVHAAVAGLTVLGPQGQGEVADVAVPVLVGGVDLVHTVLHPPRARGGEAAVAQERQQDPGRDGKADGGAQGLLRRGPDAVRQQQEHVPDDVHAVVPALREGLVVDGQFGVAVAVAGVVAGAALVQRLVHLVPDAAHAARQGRGWGAGVGGELVRREEVLPGVGAEAAVEGVHVGPPIRDLAVGADTVQVRAFLRPEPFQGREVEIEQHPVGPQQEPDIQHKQRQERPGTVQGHELDHPPEGVLRRGLHNQTRGDEDVGVRRVLEPHSDRQHVVVGDHEQHHRGHLRV